MRIMNRSEFLTQPENTVYSCYKHMSFGDLEIKGSSLENDYSYQKIIGSIEESGSEDFMEKLENAEERRIDLVMDFESQGRDGSFGGDELYAVWSKADVAKLISRLQKCL